MSDVGQLLTCFENGKLIRPDSSRANLIDLVQAVTTIAGVNNLPLNSNAREIGASIGDPEHLIFVLVDGLGSSHFDALPADSWLRSHFSMELQTVFPSTTATSITSVMTGVWPTQHNIVGWWTYIPKLRETACVLPFVRYRDGVPLLECGISHHDVFGAKPLMNDIPLPRAVIQHSSIIDSTYSGWFSSGADLLPYDTDEDAIETIAEYVRGARNPTHCYWYTSAIDHATHDHGTDSDEVRAILTDFDRNLAILANDLHGLDARIILTADHGHRNAGSRFRIEPDDPLCTFLRTPPSGDMRVGFYHLQEGAEQPFRHEFRARFGDHFALITTQELEELRLLGPDPLSTAVRERVGNLTSIALDNSVMRYSGNPRGNQFMRQRSHHSGLSASEMNIPLVLG